MNPLIENVFSNALKPPPKASFKMAQVAPLLFRYLGLREGLRALGRLNRSCSKAIDRAIYWKEIVEAEIPLNGPPLGGAFEGASTIIELPPSYWREEFGRRLRSKGGLCSICGTPRAYEIQSRHVSFCLNCWDKNAWPPERSLDALRLSLGVRPHPFNSVFH